MDNQPFPFWKFCMHNVIDRFHDGTHTMTRQTIQRALQTFLQHFFPIFTRLYAIQCMISVASCSFRLCPVLQLRYISVDLGLHSQKNIAAALWLLVFFKCAAETGSAWACRAEIMLSCKLCLDHEISPLLPS